jgi:hypothetical protein
MRNDPLRPLAIKNAAVLGQFSAFAVMILMFPGGNSDPGMIFV